LSLSCEVRRCGGGKSIIKVFTDTVPEDVKPILTSLVGLFSSIIRPSFTGAYISGESTYWEHREVCKDDLRVVSEPCTVSGRCSICGSSMVFRGDFSEYFRHVLRSEDLCPICAIPRFIGRVLNNPVVVTFHGVVIGDNARNIVCDLEHAGCRISSTGDAVFIELRYDNSLLGFLALRHTVWDNTTILNDVSFLTVSIGDIAYLSAIVGLKRLKNIPHLEKEFENVRNRLRMSSFIYQELIENIIDRYDIYLTLCELRSVVNNFLCTISNIVRESIKNLPTDKRDSLGSVLRYLENCSYVGLSTVPLPDGFSKDSLILNPLFTYVNLYGIYENIDLEVLHMVNPLMGIAVVRADGDQFGKVNNLRDLLEKVGIDVQDVSEDVVNEWSYFLEKEVSENFKGFVTQLACALTPSIVVYFGGDENLLICTGRGDDISYIRDVTYLVRNLLLLTVVSSLVRFLRDHDISCPYVFSELLRKMVMERLSTLSSGIALTRTKFPMYYTIHLVNNLVEIAKILRDSNMILYMVSIFQESVENEDWCRNVLRIPIPNKYLSSFVRLLRIENSEQKVHTILKILYLYLLERNGDIEYLDVGRIFREARELYREVAYTRDIREMLQKLYEIEDELCRTDGLATLDTIVSTSKVMP
ncbi:MAG: hypothetical protein GXO26_00820, partial [Crenarchaeota archaeon]|nr:hypothetical protein [Thermoproteota archaeon]